MRNQLWVGAWLALGLLCSVVVVLGDEKGQYVDGKGPLYHTTTQIHSKLRTLSSNWVRNITLVDVLAGSRNQLYRIYNARRINTTALSGLPTSVIICNQHAREVVSGELCFWLVRLLGQDSGLLLQWPEMQVALKKAPITARLARSGAVTKQAMNRFTAGLLTKMKVEVVPVVNQEGRDHIARTFNYNQRKTVSSQVDLNRNWAVNRAQPGSGANELNSFGEEYHGPSALSEWQVRSIYNYMKSSLSAKGLFLDVHSGFWSLMTPWGGVYDYWSIPAATLDKWQTIMNLMQAPFKDTSNQIGIASCFSSTMLYASQGSAEDTAFKDIGFPYAMTLEVYSPWLLPDSGVAWTCPTLRSQQALCNNQNRCGNSACRDRNGALQPPLPGKEKTQASAEVVAAAAAELEQLNTASDPYLKGLSTSLSSATFHAFNPASAYMYRETVARWIVAILTALDHVSKDVN